MNITRPILFIQNIQEDTMDFLNALNQSQLYSALYYQYYYSGYHLFGFLAQFKESRDEFYLLSSLSLDNTDYLNYVSKLMEIDRSKIHPLSPKGIQFQKYKGNHCQYALHNQELLSKIQQSDVVTFCVSDEFLKLTNAVDGKDRFIQNIIEENWAEIKRAGTKSGIREIIQNLNDPLVKMANGKIFYKQAKVLEQAIQYAAIKLKTGGVVIKIDKAKCGDGVEIIKQNQVQHLDQDGKKKFLQERLKHPYWNMFNIVVEDLISVKYDRPDGGAASCFFIINNQGEVNPQCFFKMVITNEKQYHGTELGKGVYNEKIQKQFKYIGQTIGRYLAQRGYRGQYGIDYLLDQNGEIYVAQANLRRTGSAPAYYFAKCLYGPEFYKQHYLIFSAMELKNAKDISFSTLIQKAEENNLTFTKEKGGIIFTNYLSMKNNEVLTIVIAKSREQAFKMIKSMKSVALV